MTENSNRQDDAQEKRKPTAANVVLGIIMVAIYMGMAYLLLFTTLFNLSDVMRYIMGGVFALYGLFRGYRLFVGMK